MSPATNWCRNIKTTIVPQANASVAHREIRHAALRMIGLAVFENIAYTSQRSNQGPAPIRIHFPAQTVDVYIHHVGIRLDSHTPNFIEDHRSCDNPARIPAQIFQQYEFLRRQIQYLSAARRLTPQKVEFEIEHPQARRLAAHGVVPFYEIAQP